jgi:hypothetical protein
MPSISSCPECHRDLTLPDLADPRQTLRCPLCDAQFPAEQVMADSVGFPPTAIIVSPAHEAPSASGTVQEAASPSAYESDLDDADEPGIEESDLDEADDDDSDFDESDEEETDEEEAAEREAQSSPDYAAFGQQAATMRTVRRTRRQASPLGALGQFVGMALGGVVGLALGYWVLLWVGGAQADFLHLRGKLPAWLLPGRRHNDAGQNGPLADQRDRRSGRTPGDVVRDPPGDAPNAGESSPRARDPFAAGPATAHSEPGAPSDARPTSTASSPLVERLPLGGQDFPEGYLGPRAFKARTVSELTAVLEKADRALRCPHCQAPSPVKLAAFTTAANGEPPHCDYCRGKPPANLTAAAFERLCDLAEALTFVQFEQDDPRRDECREAAEAIALAIGAQRERTEIAGRLAAQRLDNSQRHSNGILLAGTVQRAEREGDLFAIQLMLLGSGRPVTVISGQPPDPPAERRDRLVVLGSIIDSPRDNLAGYRGDLPQVVWGGLPLKLASAAR